VRLCACLCVSYRASTSYICGMPLGASPEYPRVPPEYPVNVNPFLPAAPVALSSWHITEHIPMRTYTHTCVYVCLQYLYTHMNQGHHSSSQVVDPRMRVPCAHGVLMDYFRRTHRVLAAYSRTHPRGSRGTLAAYSRGTHRVACVCLVQLRPRWRQAARRPPPHRRAVLPLSAPHAGRKPTHEFPQSTLECPVSTL
jgi:hypothetical protein